MEVSHSIIIATTIISAAFVANVFIREYFYLKRNKDERTYYASLPSNPVHPPTPAPISEESISKEEELAIRTANEYNIKEANYIAEQMAYNLGLTDKEPEKLEEIKDE